MFCKIFIGIHGSKDPTKIAKGLFLSVLVVSSPIPFFLMVPEATPTLAQPEVIL
jgi:hypothetical protein